MLNNISFIGSAGIPNLYGGFESFLENCAPLFTKYYDTVYVTCDSSLYPHNRSKKYNGVRRIFIPIRANGPLSIIHDLFSFFSVFFRSTYIVVLGVSGGIWFPFFYILCKLSKKTLVVNIDGVEWRRDKHSLLNRLLLRIFDYLTQMFSDVIIYDNSGLLNFIYDSFKNKAFEISYSGDHVLRLKNNILPRSALTICRIEPENNVKLLIDSFLQSNLVKYTIIGNWNNSSYGRSLFCKYSTNPKLSLLHPIYDKNEIARHRETCYVYLHGHSVGGTNPSLVEMLYYDCMICCFDVDFNRHTAGSSAYYFSNANQLSEILNNELNITNVCPDRFVRRKMYTSNNIISLYLKAISYDESNI